MADLIVVLYIIAGIVVGFAGALLGLGGGFLMVPILNLLFGFEIHQAIATSLFTIVFTSFSSSVEYLRKKITDIRLGATMIPFTISGAIIGASISALIPGNILKAVFGLVLFIASVRMFFKKQNNHDKSIFHSNSSFKLSRFKFLSFKRTFTAPDSTTVEYVVSIPLIAVFGFFAGLLAGLLGIGGGIVQVPVFDLIFGVPIHVAIATSMFIIIFTSIFGSIPNFFAGNVLISVGIFLAVGAIIGGQIGARTAQKIKKEKLTKVFAVVMALTGIRMFISLFSI